MFAKTVATAALLGSVTAGKLPRASYANLEERLSSAKSSAKSSAERSIRSDRSLATNEGEWISIATYGCSEVYEVAEGYRTGYCSMNDHGDDPTVYSIWTCSDDGTTTSVQQTTYTDSSCTQNANQKAAWEFNTGECNDISSDDDYFDDDGDDNSITVTCSDESDMPWDEWSGKPGLYTQSYPDQSECDGQDTDDMVMFGWNALGCYDGSEISCTSYSEYSSSDCTGNLLMTVDFADLPTCGTDDDDYDDDDDDDDYDDDDDDYPNYDGLYTIYTGNCDDDDDNDNDCFHEDTVITYKGKEYTLDDFQAGKEPECSVPHTPKSRGVVIETSCDHTVRVTDTHLMATSKGFQLAYTLKEGDELFDVNDGICKVQSVKKENTTQRYFGLNCIHSEVHASGLRASTFGDFHTLPSWYMYYAGQVVGPEMASTFGDYVAEWYYSL